MRRKWRRRRTTLSNDASTRWTPSKSKTIISRAIDLGYLKPFSPPIHTVFTPSGRGQWMCQKKTTRQETDRKKNPEEPNKAPIYRASRYEIVYFLACFCIHKNQISSNKKNREGDGARDPKMTSQRIKRSKNAHLDDEQGMICVRFSILLEVIGVWIIRTEADNLLYQFCIFCAAVFQNCFNNQMVH